MTNVGTLQPGVEKLYDAALLGDGWSDALETLSRAGGSRGAMLMHNRDRKLLASLTNEDIREPVALISGAATFPPTCGRRGSVSRK